MKTKVHELLSEITNRIVEAARPEMIVLFGSHASGEARADSDIDLMVIETEPFGETRSRLKEIGKLERTMDRIPAATDILVYSRDELNRFRNSPNHIIAKALKNGKVLYARP